MPAYPGFVGGSVVAASALADGERTINFYVERAQSASATEPLALYPTPGVEALVTATDAPGRGSLSVNSRTFCVMGSTLAELTYTAGVWSLTTRGTVAVDSNPATLAYNGDTYHQLFITSGNNGYVLDTLTNAFSQVRTGATTMGVHMDGYFIALDAATSTIWVSAIGDGTSWSGTQFARRSIQSDSWVSMATLDRYLVLLGTETSEVWYDSGATFPFEPHPSGLVQVGCAAPFSPKVVVGQLLWVARRRSGTGEVCAMEGFTPQVVSTFAVSSALGNYSTLADGIGDAYSELGHSFYTVTFPTAGVTWAYDVTPTLSIEPAHRWAERGTWLAEQNRYDAWRPLFHQYVGTTHVVWDWASGTVYRLSSALGADVDGRPIRRVRRPPALAQDNTRLLVPRFEVLLESGLGAVSGQGQTPQVALRVSLDGGKTWGPERWQSAGALGDYAARAFWLRNGYAFRWMPELVVTDPVPWRLLGATVTASTGTVAA